MDSALCYKKEARLSDKTRVFSKQEIDCVVGKKGNYQARDCLHIIYILMNFLSVKYLFLS
jgi:hypothetical protein